MAAGNTLTVTLVAGTTWTTDSVVDAAKLNLGDSGMIISVAGNIRLLTDVSATAPTTTGQVMIWNQTTGYWTPNTVPASGGDAYYLSGNGTYLPLPAVPVNSATYLYLNSRYS